MISGCTLSLLHALPIERLALVLWKDEQRLAGDTALDALYDHGAQRVLSVLPRTRRLPLHQEASDQMTAAFAALQQPVEVTQSHYLQNGALLFRHYQLTELELDCSDRHAAVLLRPEVILRNSYDGRTFFGLEFGCHYGDLFFRLVTTPQFPHLECTAAVLHAMLHEYTTIALPLFAQRVEELQRGGSAVWYHNAGVHQHMRRLWSNQMLNAYYLLAEPTTGWNLLCRLTRISSARTSYLAKRRSELVFAKQFGLVWHQQWHVT